MKYVEVKNLSFSYDGKEDVLKNVSLEMSEKGLYVLMGGNGSGKTTLLKIFVKFLRGYKGLIRIGGKNLLDTTLKEISQKIAFLESEIPRIPLNVEEVLSWGRFPFGESKPRNYNIAEKLGLRKFFRRTFSSLSTGEKKRILLGRIFVQDADLILIDEPFNFLDPYYKLEIADMLKILALKHAVLITTHDLNAARFLGDRIFLLKKGELQGIVSNESLFTNNLVEKIFNIEDSKKKDFLRFYGVD